MRPFFIGREQVWRILVPINTAYDFSRNNPVFLPYLSHT